MQHDLIQWKYNIVITCDVIVYQDEEVYQNELQNNFSKIPVGCSQNQHSNLISVMRSIIFLVSKEVL